MIDSLKPLNQLQVGEVIPISLEGHSTLTIVDTFVSHNRWVAHCKDDNGDHRIVKVMGESTPLNQLDAEQLKAKVVQYHHLLKEYGIPVPPNIHAVVVEREGRPLLLEFADFYGVNMETSILCKDPAKKEDKKEILSLARMGLDSIAQLFKWSVELDINSTLPVGIDMIPRNFTLAGGKITYVDLMPTKLWNAPLSQFDLMSSPSALWPHVTLEYPPISDPEVGEVGFCRHFTKVGVLVVWLTQLSKLQPSLYFEFDRLIANWLEEIEEFDVLNKFNSRTAAQLANQSVQSDIAEFTAAAPWHEVYTLREIACWIASHGLLGNSLMEVFNLTHFQEKPICPERYAQAKKIIADSLDKVLVQNRVTGS
jgi:hypothetical protein